MAVKLTWPQAVALMGGDTARLQQYAKGDTANSHPNFDLALSSADGKMRTRLLFRYTAQSYDSWDSTNIPAYVQSYLFSLLLGEITSHDDSRPDAINTYAGLAAGWLDEVVAGNAKITELQELGGAATSSGGRNVVYGAPYDPVFARPTPSGDDSRVPSHDYDFRDPLI